MNKPRLIVFVILCLLAPATEGKPAQSGSSLKLRVDVDLVTVEVSAVDKNGKPVGNLKKEDFRLYEDGKEQEIASFDAVSGELPIPSLGASPFEEGVPNRGKSVLIVFDDSTIEPQNIKKSRDSAERFVREHMRPQDLFAVASFTNSMKILQNLSTERKEVLAAIAQPASHDPSGRYYFVELLAALEKINYSIAHVKGRKSVLLYTQMVHSNNTQTQGNMMAAGNFYRQGAGNSAMVLASARKSNVVYFCIDVSGMSGETGKILGSTWPIAAATGGYSIYNTNNVDGELDKVDQRISHYYVLGFQSSNPKHDGSFRKLEVKTGLKGITLKYRDSYLDRSPIDVLASSRQEQILLTALASPQSAVQLPVAFRPFYFYDTPRASRVLIVARIRLEKAVFKKKGAQMETSLNIMGVAYAEDGGISARFSEPVPISFDREKESEFRERDLAYKNYFKLRPGKYRLKLAVSDESNNLGSAEQFLEVPAFPEQGFIGSSIVIAEQTSRLPDLIRNLEARMLDESDPLLYSGLQVEPSVGNKLPVNSAVPIVFRIYNLPGRTDQLNLSAKAKLTDAQGREIALEPIALKKSLSPTGDGGAIIGLTLPFRGAGRGKYRLSIQITEASTAQPVTLQTDVEFVE